MIVSTVADLVHAAGRFAPLCWPSPSHKYGTQTERTREVTCLDCRSVMVAWIEGREGLGLQQLHEPQKR